MSRAPLPPPPADGAWSRFEHLDRDRPIGPYPALLAALEETVAGFNLDQAAIRLAAELVALCPGADLDERAALCLLILATLIDAGQGCTRTPVGGEIGAGHLRGRFDGLLAPAGWIGDIPGDRLAARLVPIVARLLTEAPAGEGPAADLIGGPGAFAPLIVHDGWLYHQRLLHAESRLGERLAARGVQPDPTAEAEIAQAMTAVLARPAGVALSDEQQAAVRRAAAAPLTLVSGGPGTGKTSIVVALLRALVRAGTPPDAIALAAPTGKAAWRMGAAVRAGLERLPPDTLDPADAALLEHAPEPMTLHRLLGYAPGVDRFRHHAGDPLDARAVIIDECSMIDVFLMERLAAAVRPDARLVLLGDADQLPSVAAGAVFRDALDALPAMRLTRSYRMRADDPAGRAVLTVARRLNAGETLHGLRAPLDDGSQPWIERSEAAELIGEGVEHLPVEGGGLRRFLAEWYRTRALGPPAIDALRGRSWPHREGRVDPEAAAELTPLFDWLESARLLCLTRARDTGAIRTNERLHAFAAAHAGQTAERRFLAGEPVMMLHNDYDRGLFNGDQGVTLWVEADGRRQLAAVFADLEGYRVHPLATLEAHLEHAYAMTVHKAQGSEFERVAIVLPDEDLPLSSRELLYTGITRSRRGVVLVGPAARVAWAAAHPVTRFSGLAARLARGLRGAEADARPDAPTAPLEDPDAGPRPAPP